MTTMSKKLKAARNELDQFILNKTTPTQLSIPNSTMNSNPHTLYAWVPAISLLCTGELGTTSDLSSKCAPNRCGGPSKREEESYVNEQTKDAPTETPRPSFKPSHNHSLNASNPF